MSKFEETDWLAADGKLRNLEDTLDGSPPLSKYSVFYLHKKGFSQREFDITDEAQNLVYSTRPVPGTIACFDVLGKGLDEYVLRVNVDIARRYWIVCRYHVPTFEGQRPDKEASEKIIAEYAEAERLQEKQREEIAALASGEAGPTKRKMRITAAPCHEIGAPPLLFRKGCITVSWSRYMAVSALYGPPTFEQVIGSSAFQGGLPGENKLASAAQLTESLATASGLQFQPAHPSLPNEFTSSTAFDESDSLFLKAKEIHERLKNGSKGCPSLVDEIIDDEGDDSDIETENNGVKNMTMAFEKVSGSQVEMIPTAPPPAGAPPSPPQSKRSSMPEHDEKGKEDVIEDSAIKAASDVTADQTLINALAEAPVSPAGLRGRAHTTDTGQEYLTIPSMPVKAVSVVDTRASAMNQAGVDAHQHEHIPSVHSMPEFGYVLPNGDELEEQPTNSSSERPSAVSAPATYASSSPESPAKSGSPVQSKIQVAELLASRSRTSSLILSGHDLLSSSTLLAQTMPLATSTVKSTRKLGKWLQVQSRNIHTKTTDYLEKAAAERALAAKNAPPKTPKGDPLEGVIQLDRPLLLCQEIYNRIIGNHQTSLVSKQVVLDLLRQDMAQHIREHPEEVEDLFGSENPLIAAEEFLRSSSALPEAPGSPGYGEGESKNALLEDTIASRDSKGMQVAENNEDNLETPPANPSEDEQVEQPLVGYWLWENTLRTHKMKLHLAKGTDLSLHVVIAIIVNQVRYERNAIAMTV